MFENFTKMQKIAAGVGIALFIGAIMYSVIVVIYRNGKVAVNVKYAPFSAVVTLDGKRISNNGTAYVVPGTYELKIELEHFNTVTDTAVISESDNFIAGSLTANDDEGKRITEERAGDYNEVVKFLGEQADRLGSQTKEKYPILQYLPINKMIYSVYYQREEDDTLNIYIKTNYLYIESAVDKLYSLGGGISPADYSISINDYEDLFDVELNDNDEVNGVDYLRRGYSKIIGQFDIAGSEASGDYFGVVLRDKRSDEDGFDRNYRALLKKRGDGWELAAKPYPILSRYNAPDAPIDLLDKLNRM